jgi:metallo-beta-lactamase class B
MSTRTVARLVPVLMLAVTPAVLAQGGARSGGPAPETLTASRLPNTAQSTAHIEAARTLAGGDPVLMKAWNFFCTPTNYNTPAPEVEPAKVFDNLYAIPSSTRQQTIVWAITTRDGIILIDSGEQGRTEAVVAGMQKVGLDPAQVKYILLGHGHGDHFAGASYFQDRYGTRVGTTAADWDLIHPPGAQLPAANQPARPRRDLVLEAGKPVVLGEQTVHLVAIPGHTPGSLGFIFNVRENGRTHTAALFGGTILDQGRITTEGLNQYLQSIAHFLDAARKMNVDVEIQNHALFDDTPARLARLRARQAGEPNPFLMSTATYVNLWNVASECIRAEIARRAGARAS